MNVSLSFCYAKFEPVMLLPLPIILYGSQCKILLLTFKCINNLAPECLANSLKKRIAPRATRSTRDERQHEIKRTRFVRAGNR